MRLSLSVRIYRRLRIVFKGLKNSKREREREGRVFSMIYIFLGDGGGGVEYPRGSREKENR